jgi:hypothetical protein
MSSGSKAADDLIHNIWPQVRKNKKWTLYVRSYSTFETKLQMMEYAFATRGKGDTLQQYLIKGRLE